MIEPPKPKAGDYIMMLGHDSQEQRSEGHAAMQRHGCKGIRFEELEDGRLRVHLYLRADDSFAAVDTNG